MSKITIDYMKFEGLNKFIHIDVRDEYGQLTTRNIFQNNKSGERIVNKFILSCTEVIDKRIDSKD